MSHSFLSVLMIVVVPVLLCTTLSQRAVPATLLFSPVDCCIYDGRTVYSFQGAEGSEIFPSIYQPPHASAQTDKYFCKILKFVENKRLFEDVSALLFLFRIRDTVSRASGFCMVSHCPMPNFSMPWP